MREAENLRVYAEHRDPRLRDRLIRQHLPLANSIARRFDHSKQVPLEDLKQVAAIGLIKALDRYDPSYGAAFSSFAVPTIQGEIQRYFRDFTWMVRPTRETQERAIRVEREREQLTTDLGRNPTARELAAQVGCTLEDLLEASEAAQARASDSFDRPVQTPEGDVTTLGERLGDEDPGFEAALISATVDGLLDTLPERDQLVLRLRFREDLTQAEIGQRIGVTQMHVSRILRAALAQLVQNASTTPSEFNQLSTPSGQQRSLALASDRRRFRLQPTAAAGRLGSPTDESPSTARWAGPPRFSCLLSETGDMVAVTVTGELDMATSHELYWTLRNVSASASAVVLDLRELEFMDSTGLHVIVAANEHLRRDGRQLLVVRGPPPIERLFAITGIDRELELTDRPPNMAIPDGAEDAAA